MVGWKHNMGWVEEQNFTVDPQETWLLSLINIVINGWREAQYGLIGIIIFVIETLGRVFCYTVICNGFILLRKRIHDATDDDKLGRFASHYSIAFAQFEFSEALTGSVSFPYVGVPCIRKPAINFASLLSRRLGLEIRNVPNRLGDTRKWSTSLISFRRLR